MPSDIAQCPQSIVNVPSDCRIASIVPNHAMILPNDANPSRMEFSEGTPVRAWRKSGIGRRDR
jgi:hypothetical protein